MNGRRLASARILIGAAGIVKGFAVLPDLIAAESTSPRHELLAIPSVPWHVVFAIWILSAIMVVAGRAIPLTAAILAFCCGYTLTHSAGLYGNHLTLLTLMSMFLAFTSGGRLFGDSMARSSHTGWPALLMMTQVSTMYGLAAFAKINPSFLLGEVAITSIGVDGAILPLPLTSLPAMVIVVASVGVVALEGFLAVGLWFARARGLAFAGGAALHLGILATMDATLNLLVFMLASLAAYPLFGGWSRGRMHDRLVPGTAPKTKHGVAAEIGR
ncbi:HTTM domain-containing protein [Nocardiopsis coralliicola]